MSEQVGGIYYEVDARTGNLIRSERQVGQSTQRMGRNFDRLDRDANRLNTSLSRVAKSLAGVLAVRQLQRFVVGTAQAIDEQGKFAQQIGTSFEELQRLQFAAEQTGASITTLNNSLRRGSRNIQDAARGTGSAGDALERLGLEARQLASLSPDEQFRQIADAINGVASESEQAAIAYRIFGRDGEFLLNTLRQGSAGLNELGDEAERVGRVFSQQAADDAARFNDELNKLQGAARSAGVQLGSELLPALTNIITAATDWLATGDNVERLINGIGIAAQATAAIMAGRFVGALALSIRKMQGATFAARSLSFSLNLLGGPAGIATIIASGFLLMAANSARAEREFNNQELQVERLVNKYKDLDEAQQQSIRTSIAAQRAAAEARIADLEAIDPAERARQARRASGGDVRGRRPSQDRAAGEAEVNELIQRQQRVLQQLENQELALDEVRDRANRTAKERAEIERINTEQSNDAARVLTDLARRNEEYRAQLEGTTDELEVRRALQAAGVTEGTAEANVIRELIEANRGLADAIDEAAQAEQRRQELEGVAQSEIGLTRLQALEQQYRRERELLLEAQELGIESEIAYQERLLQLHQDYSERRQEIIDSEAENWKARLEEVGFSFDRFANQATGSLASVALGFTDGEDALRSLARSMLTELVGALIRMAAQAVIGQRTVEASTIASAATIGSAMAGPAAATSLATAGANAAPAQAGIASTVGVANGLLAGARFFGGNVEEGRPYQVNEMGAPEMLTQGGKQFIIPGADGNVTPMKGGGGGDTIISPNITVQGVQDANGFVDSLFDNETAVIQIIREYKLQQGQDF